MELGTDDYTRDQVTRPFSIAKVVRAAVLWTLSFCIRFDRCFSTVLTLM